MLSTIKQATDHQPFLDVHDTLKKAPFLNKRGNFIPQPKNYIKHNLTIYGIGWLP